MSEQTALDFMHQFVPGTSSRTLLLLHGTGGNENDLLSLGRSLDAEAALLSPRGKVLENGMPRFFRRLAEGVFDEQDLIQRTHELARFVESAAQHYQRDAGKVIAVGFSNGANIAAAMLLLEPSVLRGAVLLRAMVPLEPETMPDLSGRFALISAGREDPIVPPEHPQRLAQKLTAAGATVSLKWQSAGHQLTRNDLVEARSFVSEVTARH